jgi:hypothetical protein
MSIASPPATDVCDGVQEGDNDNRICHLLGKNGLPLCGRVLRGVPGRPHPTSALVNPCLTCGCRRCVECAELFVFSV